MKKVLFSIAALAVAFGFTACSNEDEALGNVKGEKTTVLAMTEVGTRTALESDGAGAYNVVWSEGDKIYIGNGHSEYKEFTLKSGAGETTATFEGEVPADGTYKVYYGSQYDTFESTQHYEAGKVSNFQMCASATVTDGKISPIQFWNVGGILRLTVKGTATIKNIKVTSEQPMSGPSSFNNETKTATASDYYNIKYVQLDCGDGVALTNEGTVFNIALLANTYTGVQITLTDADGKTLTKKFKGTDGLKIERSKITKASFTASFPPAGSRGSAKRTGDVDVKWVQLWKDGPKFAEYNVGATSATEYGGYYAWGGSQDKVDDHNTTNTGEGNLTGTDDTAAKLWGSNWRMPTNAELEALLNSDNCTCTWTENYNGTGKNGLLCTGKGDFSSNSVFLPAAGYSLLGFAVQQGNLGYYWSSTAYGSDNAYDLYFVSDTQFMHSASRNGGCSVRAVLNEAPPASAPKPLAGKFSVSDTKKVYFSKGNLWADESNVLHFESSQTAFADGYVSTHVSYFPWSDNVANAVGTVTAEEVGTYLFCDENHKISVDGSAQLYYALSQAECEYLASHHQYRFVTVNDVRGCVIAPDGVSLASDKTEYTESELEEDNLVFLPGAGVYTKNGQGEYTIQLKSSGYGRYWSSSVFPSDEIRSYMMNYDSDELYYRSVMAKTSGLCLRLVTDCE